MEKRRIAVVINLSTERYDGGEFELRPKEGGLVLRHRYTEPGEALISGWMRDWSIG